MVLFIVSLTLWIQVSVPFLSCCDVLFGCMFVNCVTCCGDLAVEAQCLFRVFRSPGIRPTPALWSCFCSWGFCAWPCLRCSSYCLVSLGLAHPCQSMAWPGPTDVPGAIHFVLGFGFVCVCGGFCLWVVFFLPIFPIFYLLIYSFISSLKLKSVVSILYWVQMSRYLQAKIISVPSNYLNCQFSVLETGSVIDEI